MVKVVGIVIAAYFLFSWAVVLLVHIGCRFIAWMKEEEV
jgi:hypothetical protein